MLQKIKKTSIVRLLIPAIIILFFNFQVFAQLKISGKVIDGETGEPLIGATIIIVGTFTGIATNVEGLYSLSGISTGSVLKVSYIGYLDQEIAVKNQTTIDISLLPDRIQLDEVVAVGYGTMKKSDLSGAVSSVDAKEMTKMVVPNVAQALQGRASGVLVTANSGAPGSGYEIYIRGTGTINNTSPLYIVDGVIVESISHIPPENIKTMEALKDAGAAAIYGSRAANGVILITTKSGIEGPTVVNFNVSYSWQGYCKVPKMMDEKDYLLVEALNSRSAQRVNETYDAYKNTSSPEDMWLELYHVEPPKGIFNNWLDLVSRNKGIGMQKYNLSVSGGSSTINYFISGNYYDQKGLVIKSGYNDKSFLADLNFKLNKRLSLRTNINYSNTQRDNVPDATFRYALGWAPVSPLYNINYGYLEPNTPLTIITQNTNVVDNNLLSLNLQLNYKISDAIKFEMRAVSLRTDGAMTSYSEPGEPYEYTLSTGSATTITKNRDFSKKFQLENILTYDKVFNKHSINAVGVVSYENYYAEGLNTSIGATLANNANTAYPSSGFQGQVLSGNAREWTGMGLVTRFGYVYDDRYLMQLNFRADASSKFVTNRWGYFPSISLAWRLSKENFLNLPIWINQLKLRGSAGQLGNNRIDEYSAYTFLKNENMGYVFGNQNKNLFVDAWAPKSIGNPYIRWETTKTYNLATDIGLFNSLLINLEYFWKYTSDMLVKVPVVPSTSFDISDAPYRNAGEVLNRGIELTLNYKNRIGQIQYDLNTNFSYIQNEITKLGAFDTPIYGNSDGDYFRVKNQVGHPIGEFYGFLISKERLNENGNFVFQDVNGDGKITESDRVPLGNPQPKYFAGLNLNLEYRGFDFSAFLQGVFKVNVWNSMAHDIYSYETSYKNMAADIWDRIFISERLYHNINPDLITWYPEDPKRNTATIPVIAGNLAGESGGNERNFRPSDFYVEDASYLRIKNIQLGYTFPSTLTNRAKINKLRIYLSAMNLFTFTNYSGLDPEIGTDPGGNRGFDNANYPQARTITAGANVTF